MLRSKRLSTCKETEGTLVLTNRRLVYAHGAEQQEHIPLGGATPFTRGSRKRLIYSDVEELDSMASDPANFSISVDSLVSVKGHRGVMAPKLEVRWNDGGRIKATEFVQQITGGSRRKNLNDWAEVIQRIKNDEQKIAALPPLPDSNSLEGRILLVLGDMQEKGLFTIEREAEEQFGIDLDPDQVAEACEGLASSGLVSRSGASDKDPFYRRVSPLGEDDLNQ